MLVCQCLLIPGCVCVCSVAPPTQQSTDTGTCTGSTKGQPCHNRALPFTRHCFQRILCPAALMHSWSLHVEAHLINLSCTCYFKITHCDIYIKFAPVLEYVVHMVSVECIAGFFFCFFFSLTVLCRHSVESFPAALCKLHSQICRWSAVLHPRVWYHAPDTPLRRACQKDGEFSV